MLIALISTVLAIVLFLCLYLGFKEGLRLGMQVAKGNEPPKIRTPVEIVKEIKKEHEQTLKEKEFAKEEKRYQEGLERLMNYTGDIEDEV